MQCVILAGGYGSRLWPLTRNIPKPMAPIAGTPFLVRLIHLLCQHNIGHFLILTGYLGNLIEHHCSLSISAEIDLRFSREDTPLGTAGALQNAASLLDTEFLLVNGDTYLDIEYNKLLSTHQDSSCLATMVVTSFQHADATPNISLLQSGYVSKYEKNSRLNLKYTDCGVYVLQKSLLKCFPKDKPLALERDVLPFLAREKSLCSFKTDRRFYDIGTLESLSEFEEFIKWR